eukprot:TRINITY_DN16481_c0_g1_i2.p1 TRINITY_DN16481_c0_g1~~TRINITY_DN16481_c0_g1_i2.p1  ORF type:complete len:104 (-),score=21.15 TRINITY_DN16481_c0_g1_i2:68-379(-)
MGQGAAGSGNTQFNGPWSVSVDSDAGVVYVADYSNSRVCVYRSGDGSYVRHFQVVQADNSTAKPDRVMWMPRLVCCMSSHQILAPCVCVSAEVVGQQTIGCVA